MIGETMNYKFNEDKILNEVKAYIGNTYDQHYANGKYQATDMIIPDMEKAFVLVTL
jgi:hypothetical protein